MTALELEKSYNLIGLSEEELLLINAGLDKIAEFVEQPELSMIANLREIIALDK